jgi:hypothetical protein
VAIRVPPTGVLDELHAVLEAIGAAVDADRHRVLEAARGISPEAVFPTAADVAAIQERFAEPVLAFARTWLRSQRPDPRLGRAQAREALETTAAAIIEQCIPSIMERVLPADYRYILHARLRWLRAEMKLVLESDIEAFLIGYAETPGPAMGEVPLQATNAEPGHEGPLQTASQESGQEGPPQAASEEPGQEGPLTPPVTLRRSGRAPKTETAVRIAAFRERVCKDPKVGTRVRVGDIAIVTGYSLSAFMQYQREDPILSAAARADFDSVLAMTPLEFVTLLRTKRARLLG